jgi:hypothetical protein
MATRNSVADWVLRHLASIDEYSTSAAGVSLRFRTAARTQIEKPLGTKVYLDLRVKVAKNWQRDPKQRHRLGF